MKRANWFLSLIIGFVFTGGTLSMAETITFSTSDNQFSAGIDNQGWWSDEKPSTNTNFNYAIGVSIYDTGNKETRNFFSFDLSSLDKTVVSARLEITRFLYYSAASSESLGLFDVSTEASLLNNNEGINLDIFNDLGTGKSYGEFEVNSGYMYDVLSFSLNSNAIDDINSSTGAWFSIGGRLLTVGSPIFGGSDMGGPGYIGSEGLFGNSHEIDGVQQLVLEVVPEPATLALLGLGGLLLRRRRKQF